MYANGSATLQNATISNCTLNFTDYDANGGAIYVMHDLTLNDSVISGNLAQSAKDAHGGGAYVFGTLVVNRTFPVAVPAELVARRTTKSAD